MESKRQTVMRFEKVAKHFWVDPRIQWMYPRSAPDLAYFMIDLRSTSKQSLLKWKCFHFANMMNNHEIDVETVLNIE